MPDDPILEYEKKEKSPRGQRSDVEAGEDGVILAVLALVLTVVGLFYSAKVNRHDPNPFVEEVVAFWVTRVLLAISSIVICGTGVRMILAIKRDRRLDRKKRVVAILLLMLGTLGDLWLLHALPPDRFY